MKHVYRKFPFPLWPALFAREVYREFKHSMLWADVARLFVPADDAQWYWHNQPSSTERMCLFVTYAPEGKVPQRAIQHARLWQEAGYTVIGIIAVDDFAQVNDIPFAHAMVRQNLGHDVGAWARAIAQSDFLSTKFLAVVNDSVFAAPQLVANIESLERSPYDVASLSSSKQIHPHLQSFATIFKYRAIHSDVFSQVWRPRNGTRQQAIDHHELHFARKFAKAGFSIGALYDSSDDQNPTFAHWPALVRKGFPYVKRSDLAVRFADWRTDLRAYGFDVDMIAADLPPRHFISARRRWTEHLAWPSMRMELEESPRHEAVR